MTVLSLFDGMACGLLALKRTGFEDIIYYAAEIDKHAIKVAKHNHPEIIHIGDVTKVSYKNGYLYTENGTFYVGKIDLLIGGSPCQGFSFAGKQLNFNDPRSKLFFEFVRLLKEIEATDFLLENVVMKKEYQAVITEHLGVQPVLINSALVSAQTRKRLYWTSIPFYGQPEDKRIYLKDILFKAQALKDKSQTILATLHKENAKSMVKRKKHGLLALSIKETEYMFRQTNDGRNHFDYGHHSDTTNEKSSCVTAAFAKGVPYNVLIDRTENGKLIIKENTKKGYSEVLPGDCVDLTFPQSKTRRGRLMKDKSNCLTATTFDYAEHVGKGLLRKFTPTECERLQTVPDGYTSVVSDSQAYKMLGNGWNVDTIVHLLLPLYYADI